MNSSRGSSSSRNPEQRERIRRSEKTEGKRSVSKPSKQPEIELSDLSYDVVFEYMLKMDPKTLQQACQISRIHADVCSDNNFWIQKINRDFPDINGHYDVTNAKKNWTLCAVGHRFSCYLYLGVSAYYQDVNIVDYNVRFPEDKEAIDYISDLIDREAIERITSVYKLYSGDNEGCIRLSNQIIYYVEDGQIVLYLRNSKSRLHKGIKKLNGNQINIIRKIINRGHLVISETPKDIQREKNIKEFQDLVLKYDRDGNLISNSNLRDIINLNVDSYEVVLQKYPHCSGALEEIENDIVKTELVELRAELDFRMLNENDFNDINNAEQN